MSNNLKNLWIDDSGATCHMVKYQLIDKYSQINQSNIQIGNGENLSLRKNSNFKVIYEDNKTEKIKIFTPNN